MEIWKDIREFEGRYQISNEGRVKSLKRKYCKKTIILKQRIVFPNKKTYARTIVELTKKGSRFLFAVHRLVAETFLGYSFADGIINHKDGDTNNNNLNNLEIQTCKEKAAKNKDAGVYASISKPVIRINDGKIYSSIREAAISVNTGRSNIINVCKGRAESCKGYRWEYLEDFQKDKLEN